MAPIRVTMRTTEDCALQVSIFPRFTYDARGGGGVAHSQPVPGSHQLQVSFDPEALDIPDVSYKTARFMGLPLIPIFRIAVNTQSLQGTIDRSSGDIELQFLACFNFTAALFGWVLYSAPPLLVSTQLTTGSAHGGQLCDRGSVMLSDGSARLAGVSEVAATGDRLLDSFLRLPNFTLAVMSCNFDFE